MVLTKLTPHLRRLGMTRMLRDKCGNRLLDLKQAIDEAEDALEWPSLLAEAEQEIRWADEISRQHGKADEKQAIATLEREIRAIIETHDSDVLRRKVEELRTVKIQILGEGDRSFGSLCWRISGRTIGPRMRDGQQADALFNLGQRAIQTGDVPGLQSAVRQLIALLPQEQQAAVGLGSTVV